MNLKMDQDFVNEDNLMLPEEARRYLKLEKSTFDHLVAKRIIPVIKIGRLNRFRKSQLDEWLEANTLWNREAKGRKRSLIVIREKKHEG